MSRILVIDQFRDSADSLVQCLSLYGHQSTAVHDPHQALDIARSVLPNAIVVDVDSFPGDGAEFCQQLRGEPWGQYATIVAMTTTKLPPELWMDIDHQLMKPVDPVRLAELLA